MSRLRLAFKHAHGVQHGLGEDVVESYQDAACGSGQYDPGHY